MKATDLAVSYYERIERVNPRLNVYLSLTKERALAQAARLMEPQPKVTLSVRSPASPSASRMFW